MVDRNLPAMGPNTTPNLWKPDSDSSFIKRGFQQLSVLSQSLPRELWRIPLYGREIDRSEFPPTLPIIPENIPAELASLRQWVAWDWSLRKASVRTLDAYVASERKWVHEHELRNFLYKVPISPLSGDSPEAGPASWSNLYESIEFAERVGVAGIGFVFTAQHPIVGIDLDNCVVAGQPDSPGPIIEDWARELISELNSYAELSPTGTGIHVLTRGGQAGLFEFSPPQQNLEPPKAVSLPFRAFDSQGGSRPLGFLTMTGHGLSDHARDLIERAATVSRLIDRYSVSPEPPSGAGGWREPGLRWLGQTGSHPAHPLCGDFKGIVDEAASGVLMVQLGDSHWQLNPDTGKLTELVANLESQQNPTSNDRGSRPVEISSYESVTVGLDPQSGDELWKIEGYPIEELTSNALCYIKGWDFDLAAVHLHTGAFAWKIDGEGEILFLNPEIYEDFLFWVWDDHVTCVNWKRGCVIWKASIGNENTNIIAVTPEILILEQANLLFALHRATGSVAWSKPLESQILRHRRPYEISLAHAYDRSCSYFWQQDDRVLAIDIATGSQLWEFDTGSRDGGTSIHGDVGLWRVGDAVIVQSTHVLYGLAKM